MESLPSAIVDFLQLLRPLFRAEVFTSFSYLMLGILIGEAKYGTARASVFAGPNYWVVYLSPADNSPRLTRRLSKGLKVLDE